MKSVLILSYFYPPCNLAASNRAVSWAKGLAAHGIRPIIVTRSWSVPVNRLEDVTIASGSLVVIDEQPDFCLVSVPYNPVLKDRWNPIGPARWIKKGISMASVILQHISHRTSEYRPFYDAALTIITKQKIDLIVVTGNPWGMFRIAHNLSRATDIGWVADYRDIWTANRANIIGLPLPYRILFGFERWFEQRIVASARAISSISPALAKENGAHGGKPGTAIYNGYNEEEFGPFVGLEKFEKFTVTYVGTLYHGQDVRIFARAVRQFLTDQGMPSDVQILFLGTGFNTEQRARLSTLFQGLEAHVEVTDRTDRQTTLITEVRSHLLMHVGWAGYQGIVGSKIYEYMASGTRILICPTDSDILEEMVTATGTGHCAVDEQHAAQILTDAYLNFKAGKVIRNNPHDERIRAFSRSVQVQRMAAYLHAQMGSDQKAPLTL